MKKYFFSLVFIALVFTACAPKNNTEFKQNKDLHYAVRVNDMMLVNEFIKNKTNLDKKDEYGYTPLHIAAKFNHFDIARVLIQNGAKVDTKDKYFDTPLIDSTRSGFTFMSELLVCNGAQINSVDKNNMSAYDYSLKSNDIRTAKLLRSKSIQEKCIGKVITPNEAPKIKFYRQISIDSYGVIENNKPKICGDIHDLDVQRVQISFDSGESVIEGNIEGNRWCAQVEKELLNGTYRVDALSINSKYKKSLASEDLEIKAINTLSASIKKEFSQDFTKWNASFDEYTLTFRFNNPSLMFEKGSNKLNSKYKKILEDFFPRYLYAIKEYKNSIKNIYVLGHTSSSYESVKSEEDKFEKNMLLSQKRADEVFVFVKNIIDNRVIENETFLNSKLISEGKSSSELILNSDGSENIELSKRVEFRIEQIN